VTIIYCHGYYITDNIIMSEEEDYYNNEESFDDYETRYSFDDVIPYVQLSEIVVI